MFSVGRRLLMTAAAVLVSLPAVVAVSAVAQASPVNAGGQLAQCPWLNPLLPIQQRVSELVA